MLIRRTGQRLLKHEFEGPGLRQGEGVLPPVIDEHPEIKRLHLSCRNADHVTLQLRGMIRAHQEIHMGQGDPIAPTQGHKGFPGQKKIGDARLSGAHKLECVLQQQVSQPGKDLFLGWHPKYLALHRFILHRQKRGLGEISTSAAPGFGSA